MISWSLGKNLWHNPVKQDKLQMDMRNRLSCWVLSWWVSGFFADSFSLRCFVFSTKLAGSTIWHGAFPPVYLIEITQGLMGFVASALLSTSRLMVYNVARHQNFDSWFVFKFERKVIVRAYSHRVSAAAAASASAAARTLLIYTCLIHTKHQWQWHC